MMRKAENRRTTCKKRVHPNPAGVYGPAAPAGNGSCEHGTQAHAWAAERSTPG